MVDADGLLVLDELPLGVFGADAGSDVSPEDSAGDFAQQTALYADYLNSVRYDAAPSLSALGTLAEEEIASACVADALVYLLQVSSQLARNSEKYYGMLSKIFTAPKLVWILLLPNPTVRAKCCNLVGNLCRYGSILILALHGAEISPHCKTIGTPRTSTRRYPRPCPPRDARSRLWA
jgi:hypothetical protein